MSQGHAYAALSHYLQAVDAAKTLDTKAVAAVYRSMPIKSGFYKNASIRPNGRVVYDAAVLRVRNPSEMTAGRNKFDLAEVVGTLSADKFFRPLNQTECKLT
jgi:branched-chain amino acid transport system substrate-binding protein